MTEAARRFSLRDLPIPAKLVITCFLLAVGGGYTAAMVQLHMRDAKSGEALPSEADVVLKYTGKKWFADDKDLPKPMSLFVKLLTTPAGAPFNRTGTMAPAFTTRDDGEFNKLTRAGGDHKEKLQPERDGERDAVVLWAQSPPDERKKAYLDDHYGIDAGKEPKAITAKFKSPDGAYKVKSIIETRCVRCHRPGGDDTDASRFSLQTYEELERYLTVPAAEPFPANGGYVRIQEPISLDKLTQSTHAHLLSFAMLFSLTGLVFAFTSYPAALRSILGPWVLIAVVADVSLWWLARLSDQWGPYFAHGIIGTGAAAGVGLMLQVTLSLLNMYGPKGKFVVLALYALAAIAAWQVYDHKVKPGLDAKRESLAAARADAEKSEAKKDPEKKGGKEVPATTGGKVARMLTIAPGVNVLELPWKAGEPGGMARAFFDKDSAEFASAKKEEDKETQQKLTPDRHGEREALLAWVKMPDAERRKAFESDAFPLPSDWGKKAITADYVKDGTVKVQSLITDRCIRCHDGDDKTPFNDYQSLSEYLK
jgi:cytochrome c553